ncbi:hypothetical protein PLESTB_001005700 [Pleodorina starrii]|uniref:Uncharacterized protein n=1 Tax=Pleodorina starrii TaxID=330485 RepID=A0A9W6F3Y1_9CHLO|nr:hypothetical protein PLESTM_001201900 [Pleodorina starrii]GLC55603.1 hypothetical protein PLESTB_001005700 [Pleodorina starrii]GLC65352.1 hypothetical protein PLESTF_000284000 [Pleodorina starrii]
MLGLKRHPKPSSQSFNAHSKRSVRVNATAGRDPIAPAATARQEDCVPQRNAGHVATCISAIAAQMLISNVAWADVARDELLSLQAAQPLTELSSGASPEERTRAPAAVAAMDVALLDVAAEAAVASPVVAMDIPAMPAINASTDVKTLVAALIRNEQFISALVNNEAFLDRLAGEDKVVEELARRKGLSIEVEARDELATELRRRQQMMDALAARGEAAVLAVADAAKQAAEAAEAAARSETREADVTGEVGVVSSGKSALVAMETAVELLEDSQELLAAFESKSGAGASQRDLQKIEAAVARAEKSVSNSLERSGSEPLPSLQDAVRELYAYGEQQQTAVDEPTINRAYKDLVTAVAEMQRAYGSAISKAVGHAVQEVVEVEEAAVQGAQKTKARLFGW